MYKTSISLLTATRNDRHFENSKNHKKLLLFNITLTIRCVFLLWFLLFSKCKSLRVAVSKRINWCFVHLLHYRIVLCQWQKIGLSVFHLSPGQGAQPSSFALASPQFRGHPWQWLLSVCLSVKQVDQSQTVQAKITNSSPSAAWKTLVSRFVKRFHKFKRSHPERGR